MSKDNQEEALWIVVSHIATFIGTSIVAFIADFCESPHRDVTLRIAVSVACGFFCAMCLLSCNAIEALLKVTKARREEESRATLNRIQVEYGKEPMEFIKAAEVATEAKKDRERSKYIKASIDELRAQVAELLKTADRIRPVKEVYTYAEYPCVTCKQMNPVSKVNAVAFGKWKCHTCVKAEVDKMCGGPSEPKVLPHTCNDCGAKARTEHLHALGWQKEAHTTILRCAACVESRDVEARAHGHRKDVLVNEDCPDDDWTDKDEAAYMADLAKIVVCNRCGSKNEPRHIPIKGWKQMHNGVWYCYNCYHGY